MNEATLELIRQLAAKLGVTVEALWGVLVKQAYINAVGNLAGTLLAVYLLYVGYRYVKVLQKDGKDKEGIYHMLYCIIAAVASLVIAAMLPENVGTLLNPEYWALKQIIK